MSSRRSDNLDNCKKKAAGDEQLEGDRFGTCRKNLAIFILGRERPNKGIKPAAPANYRTRCFGDGSVPRSFMHVQHRQSDYRRNVRGSRLLWKVCGPERGEGNITGLFGARPKAAPLQAARVKTTRPAGKITGRPNENPKER